MFPIELPGLRRENGKKERLIHSDTADCWEIGRADDYA